MPEDALMNRVQEFLNLYNQLDDQMRLVLSADRGVSHARLLQEMADRDSVFKEHHSRLQAFRALRNSIVHMPFDGESPEPIAEPIEKVVEDYRMLVGYIKDPPTALDCIATRELYAASWETRIVDALQFTLSRGFDTVPIVEEGVLAGFFSLHAIHRLLAHKLASGEHFHVRPDTTFGEFHAECAFSKDDPRNLEGRPPLVRIAPASSRIEAVEDAFRRDAKNFRFLVALCITASGSAFEPLLGLVTPHNLPSANSRLNLLDAIRRRFGAGSGS